MSGDAAPPVPPALAARLAFLVEASRRPAPAGDDPELAREATATVLGPRGLSPLEALEIYRLQFWARHLDALGDDLPGLRALLGQDAFEAFARGYLERFPPRSPSLGDLALDASAYAERYEGFPEGLAPLCRDLVRYELAVLASFVAPEPPPSPHGALARAASGNFGSFALRLCPSLRLLALDHRAHEIRLAARKQAGCAGEAARRAAAFARRPVRLAVHRDPESLVVGCLELEPDAFALLSALAEGQTVEAACDLAFPAVPEADEVRLAERVEALFRSWGALGIIAGIMPEGREPSPGDPEGS